MHVLTLVHGYPPAHNAGAETHIHSLLRAVAERGHEVTVVLSRQSGDPYHLDGVEVRPTVDQRQDVFAHIHGADVLVTHLENAHRTMLLGAWNQIPVVHVQHNCFEQSKRVNFRPQARVDLVVPNSLHMDADLTDWCSVHQVRKPLTVVARPTVDVAEYRTDRGDHAAMLNLSKNGELLRAVAERMPRTRFLAVEGSYGTQADLGGLDNVEVVPMVPHTEIRDRVWARTRVLLVPSRYESWGRVAGEAMASGIPVVCTPTDGLVEQCGDAATYCDPDDVDAYVRALSTLAMPRPYAAASRRAEVRAEHLAAAGEADRAGFVVELERLAGYGRMRMAS